MTDPADLPYSISGRERVHEVEGLRVQILTLAQGERVPWHYHSDISDVFVGQQGGHLDPAQLARLPFLKLVYHESSVYIFQLTDVVAASNGIGEGTH